LWDFSLVDPDNRRLVDFSRRERLLQDVMKNWERKGTSYVDEMRTAAATGDSRIKMFVLAQALRARRDQGALFEQGTYAPLESRGTTAAHVFGFLREHEGEAAVILAGRWFASRSHEDPTGHWWGDGHVTLPNAWREVRLRDRLTGAVCQVAPDGCLRLSQAFAHLPVAWLERVH
jgi:(1->4)-alpha-D-glucan 1-alpha-D-glucosylmutase